MPASSHALFPDVAARWRGAERQRGEGRRISKIEAVRESGVAVGRHRPAERARHRHRDHPRARWRSTAPPMPARSRGSPPPEQGTCWRALITGLAAPDAGPAGPRSRDARVAARGGRTRRRAGNDRRGPARAGAGGASRHVREGRAGGADGPGSRSALSPWVEGSAMDAPDRGCGGTGRRNQI